MKSILWIIFCVGTAMIGNSIHHSIFWTVVDFVFAPIAWAK
jgi:hypothetical protein